MSFESPLVLLALALLVAGAVAYAVLVRRRARSAAAFANPALLANVAPSAPRWRRHVPSAILALALAALIVAAAKPVATVAVPDERASIMLVTDVSGSMTSKDVAPNRLDAARSAAQRFVDDVPAAVRVGVMAFNQRPRTLQRPTRDRALVAEALDKLEPSGGTATGDAMKAALQLLRPPLEPGEDPAPAAIVLLSDGESVRGADPVEVAREAEEAGVPVYTVALGTPDGTIEVPRANGQGTITREVPPDPETLAEIARISGGEAYTANDADELGVVYDRLGSQVGTRDEERQIGHWFVGGALALLLFGTGASLAFFGRLV